MQPYRLEVAVKRVYGLTAPVTSTAATSPRPAVEVRFLDFPSIVVHPQGSLVGDAIPYNVCHKADFRMTAEQAASVFPVLCQCSLATGSEPTPTRTAQWTCPCSLLQSPSGAAAQRPYANCVIRGGAGETLGYAEMSCVVVALASPPQSQPQPSAAALPQATAAARFAPPPAGAPPAPAPSQPTASPEPHKPNGDGDQGKPYIVRVVVGDSNRRRHPARPANGDDAGATVSHDAVHRSSGGHRLSANTASNDSLLYVLQYDVAYQLQSLSETTAAVLQREHPLLSSTPLRSEGNVGGVGVARLTKSIDRSVAQMMKLANIVLQVANQLIDSSPAPPRTGSSREIKEMAQQKRNPVNKLPTPAANSVGHYLQYDVLYQLQCLGTNLSYVTLAYRDALDAPLSAIPQQHADFCASLGSEVQRLTKLLNILIQASVDGTLSHATKAVALPPGVTATADKARERKHRAKHHVDAKAGPPPRALSLSAVKTSRSSGSTYSSFSSSTSSSSSRSSSSLSSSGGSLNRPMTPVAAPPALAASAAPFAPPNVTPPLQPAPQVFATPPPPPPPRSATATSSSIPSQPRISPPPYAMVAAPLPTPLTPSTHESAPHETSHSFISVPGATPFSWVNAAQQERRAASPSSPSQPPLVPPPLSPMISAAPVPAFAPPPPPLSAPSLRVAQPRLSLPSPLAPPTAIPSPSLVPSYAAPPPQPPSSLLAPPVPLPPAPAAIPIPVPVPR